VDHVENYRLPKHLQEKRKLEEEEEEEVEEQNKYVGPGHAYIGQELATSFDINAGQDLFAPASSLPNRNEAYEEIDPHRNALEDLGTKEEKRRAKKESRKAERKMHKRKKKHHKRKDR
jgi:hypothetical protein